VLRTGTVRGPFLGPFFETFVLNRPPSKESHMHGLRISFDDADTITSSCRAIIDGKEMPEHPTTLKRVKT
ncbi:MAG TPA: hypothetical protein VLT36_20665, partial [Candidatus Dormibacteraeota bacterium]|nr:hypothetical protein [Candidatus Dormibacteraeota bacterium]